MSTHTGVEALDDGGGVAEAAAAERAREARRERRPLQPHHVPDSSAPSRPRRGGRGWRLASEDGALHAAGRKSPSTKRRRDGFEVSPLPALPRVALARSFDFLGPAADGDSEPCALGGDERRRRETTRVTTRSVLLGVVLWEPPASVTTTPSRRPVRPATSQVKSLGEIHANLPKFHNSLLIFFISAFSRKWTPEISL